MVDYNDLYKALLKEYAGYQQMMEAKVQEISRSNMKMEEELNSLSNIVEIGKYINSNISNESLISEINDIIVGVVGAKYSTIFMLEDNGLQYKASNCRYTDEINNLKLILSKNMNTINSKIVILKEYKDIYPQDSIKTDIQSIAIVPITLRNEFLGYIMVEHTLKTFFNCCHVKLLEGIAAQTAIALENHKLYSQIHDMAVKDSLLEIYNRGYFFELLEKSIKKDRDKEFAIVMIDIDNFKHVNDEFGHQFGDDVLVQFSRILTREIMINDVVGRYGGDEMILYVDDAHNKEDVVSKIENIRKCVEVEFKNKGNVTASFGISFYPKDGKDIDSLVEQADNMAYVAKHSNKNTVVSTI